MKLNQWFPEAASVSVFWAVIAINNNLPLQFSSYADILSGFVLVVFIQFYIKRIHLRMIEVIYGWRIQP